MNGNKVCNKHESGSFSFLNNKKRKNVLLIHRRRAVDEEDIIVLFEQRMAKYVLMSHPHFQSWYIFLSEGGKYI